MKKVYYYFTAIVAILLIGVACSQKLTTDVGNNSKDMSGADYFKIDASGMLDRPTDYRTWVYVGTPTTPNDMNNGKAAFPEFHNVYIDPMSYKHWKETGKFRDGTILMKELVSVGSKAAVSGNGYFMGDFIGLEATIKSKKHFPNEPGNWAYFSFTSPSDGILKAKTSAFATKDCNSCHAASAADDFVFTQDYPVLAAAKAVGNSTPENAARRAKIAMNAPKETDIWAATVETPNDPSLGIPLDKAGLFAYLKKGTYKNFKNQESESHPGRGPHTQLGFPVKVFMNDIIANSLTKKNKEHPKGSIIVKEMFDKSNVLAGWAVMVKTQATNDDGKGWFWYEVTSTSDANAIPAIGNGVTGCIDCHRVGIDQIRTGFPLE